MHSISCIHYKVSRKIFFKHLSKHLPFLSPLKPIREDILLRCVISLTMICEKVKFSNCDFVISFVIIKRHTFKLFKNKLNDVQNNGNG